MEFNKPIADMLPGMDVEGFYILRAAALKTTNNGKPFLSGTICDRTGSVEIKIWDYSGPIGARPDDTGRVVKIRGSVSEYRGALQISVHRIRMAEAADDYDTALLVPTAPIDADAALADVQRLVASITDADYRSVAETMRSGIMRCPTLCTGLKPRTQTVAEPAPSTSAPSRRRKL